MRSTVRVLVVDDSASNRQALAEVLASSGEINVVGKAANGELALQMALELEPDVITLDLEMPKMDGFTFLRILMARRPTSVVIVSDYDQRENIFRALEFGAVDFVRKPDRRDYPDSGVRREILQKVLLAASFKPPPANPLATLSIRSPSESGLPPSSAAPLADVDDEWVKQLSQRHASPIRHVVAFASSTGGPSALLRIFGQMPERFPGVLLVAQHMPEKFTKTFAERLNRKSPLEVIQPTGGELLRARRAFVSPGNMCMEVEARANNVRGLAGDVEIRVVPPLAGDRYLPSADRLFKSVARVAGPRSIGVILTGMGDDGVAGAQAIIAAGGTVLCESEDTAVVFGMPSAVIRAGAASHVMPLQAIADFLVRLV